MMLQKERFTLVLDSQKYDSKFIQKCRKTTRKLTDSRKQTSNLKRLKMHEKDANTTCDKAQNPKNKTTKRLEKHD